jgi:predicted transglutaminase-like cysteine proteinase
MSKNKKLATAGKPVTKHKPRGAPKKTFVHDPECYAISRADAYMALGVSENDAFMTVAVQTLGVAVAEQRVGQGASAGGV